MNDDQATYTDSHPPFTYPVLPPYPELILNAIETLDEKNGANKSSISRQIETTYGILPAAHNTLLSHHLNKMKARGEIVMVKNNYVKPDPYAPPSRGRGRPPKPKEPLPEGYVPPLPRPRGRPAKPRPEGYVMLPPRPRGRPVQPKPEGYVAPPPKPRGRPVKPKPEGYVASYPPAFSPPRPRGRPAKPKPENYVASYPTVVSLPRPRGRPPKPKPEGYVASYPPVVSPPRPRGRPVKPKPEGYFAPYPPVSGGKRGRPPKAGKPAFVAVPVSQGGGVKRGRGRPPKAKTIPVADMNQVYV